MFAELHQIVIAIAKEKRTRTPFLSPSLYQEFYLYCHAMPHITRKLNRYGSWLDWIELANVLKPRAQQRSKRILDSCCWYTENRREKQANSQEPSHHHIITAVQKNKSSHGIIFCFSIQYPILLPPAALHFPLEQNSPFAFSSTKQSCAIVLWLYDILYSMLPQYTENSF